MTCQKLLQPTFYPLSSQYYRTDVQMLDITVLRKNTWLIHLQWSKRCLQDYMTKTRPEAFKHISRILKTKAYKIPTYVQIFLDNMIRTPSKASQPCRISLFPPLIAPSYLIHWRGWSWGISKTNNPVRKCNSWTHSEGLRISFMDNHFTYALNSFSFTYSSDIILNCQAASKL